MANLRYTADLIIDVLFRAGEPIDGTSEFHATALSYLNRAYLGIAVGGGEFIPGLHEDWAWLRKSPPGVLTIFPLIAPRVTGSPLSVNVTFNSTALVFSATIARSLVGAFFSVDGHPDVFRIAAHTGGSANATLDAIYTGASNAIAVYEVWTLDYAIASDVMRILSPLRITRVTGNDRPFTIDGMDLMNMEALYPLPSIGMGVSEAFALVGESTVRFSHYGSETVNDLYRVEYEYLKQPIALTSPGVNEEPLVPLVWRRVLSDWATMWLLADKNDDRAEGVGAAAKSGLEAMASENRRKHSGPTSGYGKITPRLAQMGWPYR